MTTLALLATALLFGGMTLYSFGFAGFLFRALPAETAGPTIRRAFPGFYLFVIATAGFGAAIMWHVDELSALILAAIAVTTIPTRQLLMPAINDATDAGAKKRFIVLHSLSVVITLSHIVGSAVVLSRFASI
ncbi:uncharacterized protein DUF4149 [Litoreibacter ponti]|uniref:Uncharacterized protein DUF4149 n=1 Tax=Litoreibacter ponti TaxID=1510457 RepID=A0A2T6BKM8_9RHOB|nr:DUF4149 domain-containing protein [Litoreibacter ponti]PTX56602.1 uncharacterized protein DUF4149 [Litoreibacter ponti]